MTSPYTLTIDLPSTDPIVNKRLGYRLPRSILLPPYLLMNPYFVEYTDSMDDVFGPLVDQKLDVLSSLRNMWVTNPTMEQSISNNEIQAFSAWSQPEREILVKQVNMLGMKLASASVLTNDNYHAIARFVGQYWFEKGTQKFIEFINFCLQADLKVTLLWTEDYETFVPEGDPSIGTPIWEGGTWYPTTHVSIIASGGLNQLTPQTLINFFYEIANYNLVLSAVDSSYDMYVVDELTANPPSASIVGIALYADNEIAMSNTHRYGADAPPSFDTSPATPTTVLMTNPADTNYANQYLLALPTAWITDETDTKIYPVYGSGDQTIKEGVSVPTTLMGRASTSGQYGFSLLSGPVSLLSIPGSSRSAGRLPAFTAIPVARTVGTNQLSTRLMGAQRNSLLVNPDGFDELSPGFFVPYWNKS